MIRVLVEQAKKEVRIEGFDLVLIQGHTKEKIAHLNRRASVSIQCNLSGKLQLKYKNKKSLLVQGPVYVQSLGGFIRVHERQYRDDVYVYSSNGECIVVNHVDLEKYVAGLLNSEMSAKWSLQALMAQAIAARTYALFQMKGQDLRQKKLFDIQSTVKDQVYEGAHKERYKTLQAVQQTRGLVLTYQGEPIKAFYHSTCGGQTVTPDQVWGKPFSYFQSVDCPFCRNSPRFQWSYRLNTPELEQKLRQAKLLRGRLISLHQKRNLVTGRAKNIEVRGTLGRTWVSAEEFRRILGTNFLRSTDFSVNQRSGVFVFEGFGSGHGVGMCQWGAKDMADRGRSYIEILRYYYPRTEISQVY